MYKFSSDTVINANEKLKRTNSQSLDKEKDTNFIDVSVAHCGKTYKKRISLAEIRNAYGRALKELSL